MGARQPRRDRLITAEPFVHPTKGDLLLVPNLVPLGAASGCTGCIFDNDHPSCTLTACTRDQIVARTLEDYIAMKVAYALTGTLPP